ncbi:purine-nucleoside phosphorylase [Candidatus Aerophobetes bacterium Ae_b3a]|nr:MAG: purine-nucleoside phosphorylase [Candidatus Aerophobetes bacterium Ae_b3a]
MMEISLRERIKEAGKFIQSKTRIKPRIGIILGTGLGDLTKEIEVESKLSYQNIPYFAVSTTPGHEGSLILGRLVGKMIMAMQGRFHFYEGYSLEEITFPLRVMKYMGVNVIIESNAAGGMNPNLKAGDLMVITDHINLIGNNPLIGSNDDKLGPRFVDMCEPYDKELIELYEKVAMRERIRIHRGVYVGVSGPNLETPAEYRFLRLIGADAVGMSTVPEVIVAKHSGLKVLGISCITDECFPDKLEPVNLAKLIKVANLAEPKMTRLIKGILGEI